MVKEKWAANSIGEIQAATVRSGVMDKLLRTLYWQCRSVHLVTFVLLVALAVDFFGYDYLNLKSQILKSRQAGASMAVGEHHGPQTIKLSRIVYPQPDVLRAPRTDVPVLTLWLAPIVWEGTFNIDILDEQFQRHNVTIGLTVFAVGRYIGYLKAFLQTAEGHFMVGHRVNYYIFTDQPDSVPQILLQKRRQMVILKVQSYARWQDISMSRMETISIFSQERFHREVNYLVCVDVDVTFRGHVGVEILSSLFGTLHPAYYAINRQIFPYERDPQSQASILADEGDFYYTAALFGGSVPEVYRLTKACHQAMMMDQANHIEAVWHDESHLNKYLLYHKPTKVLSPEYMCNEAEECLWFQIERGLSTIIQQVRLVALQKNMSYVRTDERSIQRGSENGNGSQPHSFS